MPLFPLEVMAVAEDDRLNGIMQGWEVDKIMYEAGNACFDDSLRHSTALNTPQTHSLTQALIHPPG